VRASKKWRNNIENIGFTMAALTRYYRSGLSQRERRRGVFD
jgi:hypothetical protein